MASDNIPLDPDFEAARQAYLKSVNDPEIELPEEITADVKPGLSGVQVYQDHGVSALLVPVGEEEGAGTLPTRGRKMKAIRPAAGYSLLEFRNAVVSAYHEFLLEGSVTVERIAQQTGMTTNRVGLLVSTVEFKRACEIRGVMLGQITGLTAEQDLCLQIVLDPYDNLTMSQKLKRAGVSNSKFQAWMKQPLFRNQVNRVSEQLLDNNATGLVQLERLVGEGDLRAIQFKFEMNNRYNPRREQVIDVLTIMNKMMEVLAKQKLPAETLMAISIEMRNIAEEAIGPGAPKIIEA